MSALVIRRPSWAPPGSPPGEPAGSTRSSGSRSKRGLAVEPWASMPRDDVDHQRVANHAAARQLLRCGAFDADAGHEWGRSSVFGPDQAMAAGVVLEAALAALQARGREDAEKRRQIELALEQARSSHRGNTLRGTTTPGPRACIPPRAGFRPASLTRWRQQLGEERLAALLQESLRVAHETGALAGGRSDARQRERHEKQGHLLQRPGAIHARRLHDLKPSVTSFSHSALASYY